MCELADLLAEFEAKKRWAAGEVPSFSTDMCESLTCGYGELSDYGYWEFPLYPAEDYLERKGYMFDQIIKLSRINPMPIFARSTKLTEEVGEFAEALLHHEGYLPHKVMKEGIEGEAADIIICVIDVLVAAYPTLSDTEIVDLVNAQLHLKSEKWRTILDQHRQS